MQNILKKKDGNEKTNKGLEELRDNIRFDIDTILNDLEDFLDKFRCYELEDLYKSLSCERHNFNEFVQNLELW